MTTRTLGTRFVVLTAALYLIAGTARTDAAETWIEITSPHFRVVSNNGERSARQTAWQFEQIRAGIAEGWPWAQTPLDRPLLIVGVKDENTLKAWAPGYYEPGKSVRYSSISASDWDRHYIVMRADLLVDGGEGVNPYRTSYWTYCNLMMSSAFNWRLPVWFARGLAGVLSNTNVTDKEVQFGRAVPSYIQEFKSGGRYPLDQLFSMTRQSPELNREVDRQRFDAETWALVHYLLFANPDAGERQNRINALAAALTGGMPSAQAVEQVYGPLPALDAAYRGYIDRGVYRYSTLRADLKISSKDFAARPVDAAEAAALRAGYLVATNRPVEARAAIDQSRQLAPSSPLTFEVEGLMLEHARDLTGAQAAYEKAVAAQSANFLPYVRLASLLAREGPAADALARRRDLLEKAVALNDSYPQSLQALAAVQLQLGAMDDAIATARRAVAATPGDVFVRVTLAQSLARTGKKDDALAEAKAALGLARTDAERQAVQSTIAMIERIR